MSFDDFLTEQMSKMSDKKKNAEEKVVRFKGYINDFYNKITGVWLKDSIQQGKIIPNRTETVIEEERLGSYKVESLCLEIAGEKIVITPVGTCLIGTDARFDISYRYNEAMIVRDMETGDWLLVDRRSKITRAKVDASVFQELIMSLMQ